MRRSLHYALRLWVIVAVIAFGSSLLAPAPQQTGPYASALSSLALGTVALATPSCPMTYCPGLHTNCGGIQNPTKCQGQGTHCRTVSC